MKLKSMLITAIAVLFAAGSAMASMGGGMGGGGGTGGGMGGGMGGGGGTGGGGSMMGGGGPGSGMGGSGGMTSRMYTDTLNHSYLTVLNPITSSDEAIKDINAFITAAGSKLQISELWEYQTVYKAQLSDTNGNPAFDIVADKLTGAVQPQMGMSMMLNASYGSAMMKTFAFGRKLSLTADQATTAAQAFVTKNSSIINYTLGAAETYPGFYKFHTTDATTGNPGIDIMVNGYNGRIWMDTQLGAPISQVALP